MRAIQCLPLALVCACYNLVPLQDVTPTPGTTVVIELEEPVALQMPGVMLQNLVRTEGTFLANSADSLIVSADYLWSAAGVKHRTLGARLPIARHNAVRIQERRVSTWKSLALVGAGAAALGVALFSVDQIVGGTSNGRGGGTDPK